MVHVESIALPAPEGHAPAAPAVPGKKRKSGPSSDLPLARKAYAKVVKMKAGSAKHGTTGALFRGPIALARIDAVLKAWHEADAGVGDAGLQGRTRGESLQSLQLRARNMVQVVHDFVDVYYPHGSVGRALFFPAHAAGAIQADFLDAVLKGLEADAHQAEPLIPACPETHVPAGRALVRELRAAATESDAADDEREGHRGARRRAGEAVRDLAKTIEKAVRALHKHDPEKLIAYGLKPRAVAKAVSLALRQAGEKAAAGHPKATGKAHGGG